MPAHVGFFFRHSENPCVGGPIPALAINMACPSVPEMMPAEVSDSSECRPVGEPVDSCKTRLPLNQLLAALANSQPNVTHGTNTVAWAERVTITSQRCLSSSSVAWLPDLGSNL